MKLHKKYVLICVLAIVANVARAQNFSGDINGRGLSFKPDATFTGADLKTWKIAGEGKWSAKEGTIKGTISGNKTALLFYGKSFQDITIHTLVRFSKDVEAGILFRAEQTPDEGTKGILVSFLNGEGTAYRASLNKSGEITDKKRLRPAGGMIRALPPLNPEEDKEAPEAVQNRRRENNDGPVLPIPRPDTRFIPNDWNQLEFVLDMNILRGFINDGSGPGGAAYEEYSKYGPFALYIKGTGQAEFKDLKYKDLAIKTRPVEKSGPRFTAQRLSDMYYSFSSAAADFNNDGIPDVAAGPFIYYGPDYTTSSEIFQAATYNPSKDFPESNTQYAYDFNGDGWPDIFIASPFGRLYINPKGQSRRWDVHSVIPGNINSEVTIFQDIDGDGKPELIYGTSGDKKLKYSKYDPSDPTKPWKVFLVSEAGYYTPHGIGAGDINGDGKVDILNPNGWWEQPAVLDENKPWTYHAEPFARYGHRGMGAGGSVMAVYDVNGDGLNDVVTSLNAHGFGLAWYEQKHDGNSIYFKRHMIMDDYSTDNPGGITFSELHGATFGDVDGDGIPDFIVGKRYWSHLDTHLDPDPHGDPVLYYFKTIRDSNAAGGARFAPELIHNLSGAGSDLLIFDLNKDGKPEVISSTDRGTYIFWNNKKPQ